jgi:hypothetical protein
MKKLLNFLAVRVALPVLIVDRLPVTLRRID